jgi:hypothetical protein
MDGEFTHLSINPSKRFPSINTFITSNNPYMNPSTWFPSINPSFRNPPLNRSINPFPLNPFRNPTLNQSMNPFHLNQSINPFPLNLSMNPPIIPFRNPPIIPPIIPPRNSSMNPPMNPPMVHQLLIIRYIIPVIQVSIPVIGPSTYTIFSSSI